MRVMLVQVLSRQAYHQGAATGSTSGSPFTMTCLVSGNREKTRRSLPVFQRVHIQFCSRHMRGPLLAGTRRKGALNSRPPFGNVRAPHQVLIL